MYRWVFSTSYDLLLYWSAASGEQPFDGFKDYFWARDCNAFDESTIWLHDAAICTRLCFLHGALHLVVLGSGLTRKRTTTGQTLLDQFGRPCGADATARPLIVSEGQASEKKRSIAENDYLTYCWEQLKRREAPLVVFGHSLRDQDSHLIEALNEHPERPLAIGLRDHGAKSNRREKHRIASLRDAERIHFYDSTTYPRGRSELALHEAPWRKHLRPGSGRAA